MLVEGPDDAAARALSQLLGRGEPAAGFPVLARLGLTSSARPSSTDVAIRGARLLGWGRARRFGADGPYEAPPRRLPRSGPLAVAGYAQHPECFGGGVPHVIDRILGRLPERRLQPADDSARTPVHLRHGDYVRLGWELPASYYRSALRVLAERGVPLDNGSVMVGDDRMAAQGLAVLLRADGWQVGVADPHSSGPPEAEMLRDFRLVPEAPVVVMSNSTFCSWATSTGDRLLGGRPVVFPHGWTGAGGDQFRRSGWSALQGLT